MMDTYEIGKAELAAHSIEIFKMSTKIILRMSTGNSAACN